MGKKLFFSEIGRKRFLRLAVAVAEAVGLWLWLWLWLASPINKKTLVTLVNIYLTHKKNYSGCAESCQVEFYSFSRPMDGNC